jgi:flavin-binding protein dodecin
MIRTALVAELSVTSDTSFEDAISGAIEEAKNNLGDVMSVWVKEQRANVTAGQVGQYQVNLLVTYTPLVWKPHVM